MPESESHRKYMQEYRKRQGTLQSHTEYMKTYVWEGKKRQGLTKDEIRRMYRTQRGRCAICTQPLKGKFHVDHDHKTGKPRKLLCQRCNVGLGMFQDSIALLARAIVYLEDHGKRYSSKSELS